MNNFGGAKNPLHPSNCAYDYIYLNIHNGNHTRNLRKNGRMLSCIQSKNIFILKLAINYYF